MPDFSFNITPRFYETDAMGHVNNCSISGWFELARIRFMESLEEGKADAEKSWVLASLHLDFLGETFYGRDVTAAVTGAKPGNSSVTIDCEMIQQGRCTVWGRAVLVHIDRENKKSAPLPEALRQKLEHLT